MFPWSVIAIASIPDAFACSSRGPILLAPSSRLNWVWTCRWAKLTATLLHPPRAPAASLVVNGSSRAESPRRARSLLGGLGLLGACRGGGVFRRAFRGGGRCRSRLRGRGLGGPFGRSGRHGRLGNRRRQHRHNRVVLVEDRPDVAGCLERRDVNHIVHPEPCHIHFDRLRN